MLQKKERPDIRLRLFDIVELRSDVSEPASGSWGGTVAAGALGTIVDELRDDHYLVEFGGDGREPDAILTLPARLLALHWASPI